MPKRSYSADRKYELVQAYEQRECSRRAFSKKYEVSLYSIDRWCYVFHQYGIEGLKESKTRKSYSKELKEQAVTDYLSGNYSYDELVKKYELSDLKLIRQWVKRYNCHGEVQGHSKGMDGSMTKGRTTTFKERIDIVQDCLSSGKNYHQTAKTHGVSYQQVYQWVRKFEAGGCDALKDQRGRSKSKEALSAEEKMKLEIHRIEKENERLRAENAFLKKLQEIERRRR